MFSQPPQSTERFFERDLETRCEKLGSASGGDRHNVLAADAEFAGDVDAGFVGEGHPGFENGFAGVDEIGMLVDVEADAVADAMSEEFVAGAVACGCDDGAGGIIHGAGEFSGAGGVESGVLGFADGFESALDFLAGLAKNAGARDVGAVAFDGAAIID